MLFADLRGFTSWSETHSSSDAADLVSRFYASANRVLTADDAFVDFIGDQVMAITSWICPRSAREPRTSCSRRRDGWSMRCGRAWSRCRLVPECTWARRKSARWPRESRRILLRSGTW
ncbi:hypothetical protein JQ632_39000 [Bradyrhizobium liaoningense]|nr:hypothetical protein [Bradyrhizobium liaoningense]